jgi:predicted ferric reductase
LKKAALVLLPAINVIVVVGFWLWNTTHHPLGNLLTVDTQSRLLALGRLTGLLAVCCVLLQLIFVGRVKWVESTFGLDHLTRAHHFNAWLILVLLAAHVPLLTISNAMQENTTFTNQMLDFLRNWDDVPAAFAAWLLFFAVVALSITIVKKHLNYEWWHSAHLLAYLAIFLAFGHQFEIGGDFTANTLFAGYWYGLYALVGINLIGYRVIKPLFLLWKYRFVVDRVVRETDDVVSIYIRGRNLSSFRVAGGQFLILRFLVKGFRWQAHPFSLSCPPNGNYLRVSVKNSGDFTAKVPNLQPGTLALIDGPHGIFTSRRSMKNKVLLIAGGIGITPLRSMADALESGGKNIVLLYGNRRHKDVVFQSELDPLSREGQMTIHYVFSAEPNQSGEQGYIDRARIQRLVPDVAERDVFLCGPPSMMTHVIKTLARLEVPAKRIFFERFAL